MTRHRPALWIAIVAVVVVNGAILWNRLQRPYEPIPIADKGEVAQILEWEPLPVVSLAQPLPEVEEALTSYRFDLCPEDLNGSKVALDQLAPSEKEDLFAAIATLLQCYLQSSPTALMTYMEGRKEKFNPQIMDLVKKEKIDNGLISREELTRLSDKDFFVKVWDWHKCHTYWDSVVERAGYVCVWRSRDAAETRQRPVGKPMKRIFRNITNYAHLFQPAATFEQACGQPEGALVAEAMVLIQHNDVLKKERSPYFLRFWFSDQDKMWHPLSLSHVQANSRRMGETTDLLF